MIDTSGSVSDAELGSALLEVAAISRAVGGRRDLVSVISCDAAAGSPYRSAAPRTSNWQAAGARICAPVSPGHFAPRPDVIVALTDGQTPWPSAQPPCRTVVGLFPVPPAPWTRRTPTTSRAPRRPGPASSPSAEKGPP
ncbi:VWA-like domain-containing protein [Streptomyces sp. INA 01156]